VRNIRLDDQGEVGCAEFARLLVALAEGSVAPAGVQQAAGRLRELRSAVSRDWADQCTRVRSGRPLRFRITAARLDESRQWTILRGVVESGTVRLCDGVAVLFGGGVRPAWVQ